MKFVHDHAIQAIVDLAADEPPVQHTRDVVYVRIPLIDGAGNQPEFLELAVRTVEQLIRRRVKTMVACSAGMSRSPVITAAAISLVESRPFADCLTTVAGAHTLDVSPSLFGDVAEWLNQRQRGS